MFDRDTFLEYALLQLDEHQVAIGRPDVGWLLFMSSFIRLLFSLPLLLFALLPALSAVISIFVSRSFSRSIPAQTLCVVVEKDLVAGDGGGRQSAHLGEAAWRLMYSY